MNNKFSPESKKQKSYFSWLFLALLAAIVIGTMASDYIGKIVIGFFSALMPVIIGIIIAFVFKRVVDFLDNKVLKHLFKRFKKGDVIRRVVSISIIFILLVVVLFVLIVSVLPSVANFITQISTGLDGYIESFKTQITDFFSQYEWFQDVDINQAITDAINDLINAIRVNVPIIISSVLNIISSTANFVMNFLLGMMLAFLILKDKEKIASYSTRLVRASVNKKRADYLIDACRKSDNILYNYVMGKVLESLVYVIVLFPGFSLLNVPYALGMTILFALFIFIPYFGAYIAMIPITLFTAVFVDLATGLWALLYINVIMTILGYTITPLIYGKKLRVNALVITLSIIVGGGMFGFMGMLFGPPLAAIIYVFVNEFITKKEEEKQELLSHNISQEDMNDYEILEQAAEIVKQRRLKEEYELKLKIINQLREEEIKEDKGT